MPISRYFQGHGEEVMRRMQEQYGAEKGKQVFYATANKHGLKPATDENESAFCHRVLDHLIDCMEAAHRALDRALDAAPNATAKESFQISTTPEVMERFKKFLAYVQWCAHVGHSCTVEFSIDGDGADSFDVKGAELPKVDQDEVVSRSDAHTERLG